MQGEFLKVEYGDFKEQVAFIEAKEQEAIKNQYRMSCFSAWQGGAGEKKSFNEYLNVFGLGEKKKKLTKKQKKQMASKGVHTAMKILRMKSKRKPRK